MIRVTIEIVPYGVEELSKTISEVCIANVGGSQETNIANYEAAGYHIGTDDKLEEFAVSIKEYERNSGALNLVSKILSEERSEISSVKLAERLLERTRLNNVEE